MKVVTCAAIACMQCMGVSADGGDCTELGLTADCQDGSWWGEEGRGEGLVLSYSQSQRMKCKLCSLQAAESESKAAIVTQSHNLKGCRSHASCGAASHQTIDVPPCKSKLAANLLGIIIFSSRSGVVQKKIRPKCRGKGLWCFVQMHQN